MMYDDDRGDRAVTETGEHRVLRARIDLPFKDVKDQLLNIFEREYVIAALQRHHMNLSAASRETGLSRKHLRHLMHKHGLGTERRLLDDTDDRLDAIDRG